MDGRLWLCLRYATGGGIEGPAGRSGPALRSCQRGNQAVLLLRPAECGRAAKDQHIVLQGINLNPELGDASNDYTDRIRTLKAYVRIDKEHGEITGYNPDRVSAHLGPDLPNFKGYFIIQFDKKIRSFGVWDK